VWFNLWRESGFVVTAVTLEWISIVLAFMSQIFRMNITAVTVNNLAITFVKFLA